MNIRFDKRSSILSIAILLLLSCFLMAASGFAEDAGDGSGGGQGVPLELASSIPADGQKNVAVNEDIKLTFNKNVIYLEIRENNKKCFSLLTADGSKVPIEVIMADDQINPEEKRNISIHPLQVLKPGTAYAVKISPTLQAKNGTSLGREVTINFVTAGTVPKPAPAAPTGETVAKEEAIKAPPTAEKSEVTNTVTEEQKASGVEKTSLEDKVKQGQEKEVATEEKLPVKDNPQDEKKPNRTYAIIAGLVLVAGAGYLQARKRRQK